MRRYLRGILPLLLLLPCAVQAAEITDVLDAVDGDDPYDFNLEVGYERGEEWGLIQREYHCTNTRWNADGQPYALEPGAGGYDPNCAASDRIVTAREMDYRRTVNLMNLVARFGIFRDLEFRFKMPFVISDSTTLSLAGTGGDPKAKPVKPYCVRGQDCSPSSIYQTDANGVPDYANSLFELPNDSPERTGVGDLSFALAWAPWNDARDDTAATWQLELAYLAPTAEAMTATNTAVGRKLHELSFATRMSRRFTKLDPYVGFDFTLVLNSSKSLFKEYGAGQTLTKPGNRFGIVFGTEIVPWENPKKHQRFTLDFGGRFGYRFEGRDYSPLFSALGGSSCNDAANGCSLTTLRGTVDTPENDPMRTDGLTDVEQFGQVWGWFGFNVQAAKYVKFRAQVAVSHQFAHFLTNADSGKDNGLEETQIVDGREVPKYRAGFIDPGTEEENPVFNPNLDMMGRRLRLAEHIDLHAFVMAAITF